jgi:RHS repeat-associated protein
VNGDCIDVSYDADGLVTQVGALAITREAQKSGMIAGATVGSLSMTRSNNEYGEADSEQHSFSGNTLLSASYSRDLLGRIVSRNLSILGSSVDEGFHYDAAGRLDQVTRGNTTVSYQYDSNGNRLAKTTQTDKATTTISATYDDQDRLLAYGDCRYAYTANGELKSKRCGDKLTQYDYDVLGNLRKVVLPGESPSVIEYVIDGQNRRVGRKVNGVLQQGWLYGDQLNPIAELDGNNNVVSRFVYGTQGHVPDYMVKDGVGYRYITDHLGSPRLVVNATSGEVAQQLDYDEFGMMTRDTNPGFQPFGYAGGIYETSSGLTRFGYRDYDAVSGRWTSKDPLGFGGGSNFYEYVLGNPIGAIDIWGLMTVVYVNNNGFYTGTHAGLVVGGDNGILYDPGGSYISDNTEAGGYIASLDEVNLIDYLVDYQLIDGDNVQIYVFDTSPEEEERIIANIYALSEGGPGNCAHDVSSVLNGVGVFKDLGIHGWPRDLGNALRGIKK